MPDDRWFCVTVQTFHIEKKMFVSLNYNLPLCEKCPYSELFWSAFSRIWTSYGETLQCECGKMRIRITPNTDTFYAVYFLDLENFTHFMSQKIISGFTQLNLWMLLLLKMMINCFCSMVDRRNVFGLISSRDHCQISPSRIFNTPRPGFDFDKWCCALVITTTPRSHKSLISY